MDRGTHVIQNVHASVLESGKLNLYDEITTPLTIQSSENPSIRLIHCACPGGLTKQPCSALKQAI